MTMLEIYVKLKRSRNFATIFCEIYVKMTELKMKWIFDPQDVGLDDASFLTVCSMDQVFLLVVHSSLFTHDFLSFNGFLISNFQIQHKSLISA